MGSVDVIRRRRRVDDEDTVDVKSTSDTKSALCDRIKRKIEQSTTENLRFILKTLLVCLCFGLIIEIPLLIAWYHLKPHKPEFEVKLAKSQPRRAFQKNVVAQSRPNTPPVSPVEVENLRSKPLENENLFLVEDEFEGFKKYLEARKNQPMERSNRPQGCRGRLRGEMGYRGMPGFSALEGQRESDDNGSPQGPKLKGDPTYFLRSYQPTTEKYPSRYS